MAGTDEDLCVRFLSVLACPVLRRTECGRRSRPLPRRHASRQRLHGVRGRRAPAAIRLFWKRPDGTPYARLNALPQALDKPSDRLVLATNAGMFDPAYKPVGLYVENGRELVRANTRSGWGNFHMKPNGIFYVAGDKAGVLETGAYLKQQLRPDIATQSGPMLVINGRLHPRFVHANVSLKQRSGVGVRDAQTVVFAISDDEVSFQAFGRLFRDRTSATTRSSWTAAASPPSMLPRSTAAPTCSPSAP